MPAKQHKLIRPTPAEDVRIQAGIDQDPENPEWSEEDFNLAVHWSTPTPPTLEEARELVAAQKGRRKVAISIRLDRDVLDKLRASGPNWQRRVNDLLRRYG